MKFNTKVWELEGRREEGRRMKSVRSPPRLEPRRTGNALIIAVMLLSLCILSFIKARYCPAPYAKLQPVAGVEPVEVSNFVSAKSEEAALAEDEDEEVNASITTQKIVVEKTVISSSKLICSETSNRSNVCTAEGDIRLQGSSQTITFHPSLTDREWKTKPYCRKNDAPAMQHIKQWTLKPFPGDGPPPQCTVNYSVPALVFSIGGFTGNLFHDFTDVIVPLFISSYQFHGEVQFVIPDIKSWWVTKFSLILKQLSNYDIIDADNDDPDAVRCFPRVIVGLSYHKELGVDPAKTPTGYSVLEFKEMLRKAYGLERARAAPRGDQWDIRQKPRLLIITRKKTRVFLNERGMTDMATSVGFDVRVAEPDSSTDLAKFARLVNSADVMIGVHGAGLTNMVFLPAGAVLIQVVPMGGLGWLARETFKDPSPDMQIKYLDYHIQADESSLSDQYPKDHPVLKNPSSINNKGWYETSRVYLENQNVRPHLSRLRNTLREALKHLPHGGRKEE
ncbi:protein O-linked-mannose beta-1,4-N-acetylglucosaminyltransferase 2-like [Canna indica]|uniref:Protein O-linked-mannose beta-1,4-N-acetylglucosaminyltransferase 2-like n=1 Tax=Canna indica TaxID=4628 RepID=A0AAQ3K6D2_9LILI|nr:protein O-linked-mannose beta-1,4-N-acetylglucosaminyltransferase 2-like [Canna indica]